MWYVQLEGTLKHRDSDDEYDVQLMESGGLLVGCLRSVRTLHQV